MGKLVLASSSPRRQELMEMMRLDFTIVPSKIEEEEYSGLKPVDLVRELARAKAEEVAELVEEAVVVGSDTIVVLDGVVIGKPVDQSEAVKMLKKMQDRQHTVITGLAVCDSSSGKASVDYDKTEVFMMPMSEKDISSYVNTGEPMDKAGAYGIQGIGGAFIEKIVGSYFTVMGLPIHKLAVMLKEYGIFVFN